jgi:hypothetical protein
MKFTLRLPTDTYAYIEQEVDVEDAQEAVEVYKNLQEAWKGDTGEGLSSREYCRFIDEYINTGKPPEDGMSLWQDMDSKQRHVVNEIKKALARATRRT